MREEDGSFGAMEVKVWRPNVLSFQIQVGQKEEDRWHCAEGYLPGFHILTYFLLILLRVFNIQALLINGAVKPRVAKYGRL